MATSNLVTVAEYKAYIGIVGTTEDGIIAAVIPKVSQLVRSICRRSFTDYVDEYKVDISKGGLNNRILLAETPVLSIGSIEFSDDYGKTYTELVEFTDFVVDQEAGAVELISYPYQEYNRVNAFKISYNAGYLELPEDLKLAVFDLIKYYIRNDAAIHSQKAVGTSTLQVEYILNTNLPAHIKRVLDLHTAFYG